MLAIVSLVLGGVHTSIIVAGELLMYPCMSDIGKIK